MKRKLLAVLVAILLVIQVFRPDRNVSAAAAFAGRDDITALAPPPPEVRKILEAACYDCHSNHTEYPWYSNVQPVGWWLAQHVHDGKKQLNFSEFNAYSMKRKMKKLEDLCDEVREGTMPYKSYGWMHRGARLSESERSALCAWSEAVQEQLAGK
ncbi:MAG: hypothetical protein JWM88_1731 [Verrucomicrobia bacterium]|nr:hypothetical protein [Verrucomicrobiota bacterium]